MVVQAGQKGSLPKFPASVEPWFRQLCEKLPVEKVGELRCAIDQFLLAARKAAQNCVNVDLDLAERCASSCQLLLDSYVELDDGQQALVIGAVRYLVTENDPLPDTLFATGFDDDAAIINYVLRELGLDDQMIKL